MSSLSYKTHVLYFNMERCKSFANHREIFRERIVTNVKNDILFSCVVSQMSSGQKFVEIIFFSKEKGCLFAVFTPDPEEWFAIETAEAFSVACDVFARGSWSEKSLAKNMEEVRGAMKERHSTRKSTRHKLAFFEEL